MKTLKLTNFFGEPPKAVEPCPEVPKKGYLGIFLKSINNGKENLMIGEDAEEMEKEYPAYVVNRCLSNFPDTLIHAQEMNLRSGICSRMQYDFFLHGVRKRKRFSEWQRAESVENIKLVKEYYGYSNARALEALRILTEEDIEYIQSKLYKGGLEKKKKKKEIIDDGNGTND